MERKAQVMELVRRHRALSVATALVVLAAGAIGGLAVVAARGARGRRCAGRARAGGAYAVAEDRRAALEADQVEADRVELEAVLAPGAYAPALGLEAGDDLVVSVDPTSSLPTLFEADLELAELCLRRARTAGDRTPGPFGAGWRAEFAARLEVVDPDHIVALRLEGATAFARVDEAALPAGEELFVSLTGDVEVLHRTPRGATLEDLLGRSLRFDPQGALVELAPGYRVERSGPRVTLRGERATVELALDGQGRVARAVARGRDGAPGPALAYRYGGDGELVAVEGARARGYEARAGRPTRVAAGERELARLEYDAAGRVAALVTPTTEQRYARVETARDEVELTMTSPSGAWRYAVRPERWTVDGPGGRTTTWLDGRGRVVASQREGEARVERALDAAGRPALTGLLERASGHLEGGLVAGPDELGLLSPGGLVVVAERDALGRVAALEARDEQVTVREALTWAADGRVAARTGPDGRTTRYARDGQGRPVREEGPAGVTTFGWQGGSLERVGTPAGRSWWLRWDAPGRLASVEGPGGRLAFETDALGRVVRATDDAGKDARTTYDALGRPTAVVSRAGGDARTFAFAWDGEGLTSACEGEDEVVVRREGAVTHHTARQGGAAAAWRWTALASGARLDAPWGTTTVRTDEAGRVASLETPAGRFGVERDARGLPSSVRYPNGVVTHLERDGLGRVVRQTATRAGARAPVLELTHAWSARHERERTTREGAERTYSFDAAGRLARVEGGVAASWRWSGDGDRLDFSYDARGRLAGGPGGERFVHDAAGRLVRREHAGGVDAFGWDELGRLTRVARAGAPVVAYGYDPLGRLATRTVASPEGEVTTRLVWDGQRLLAELDLAGRPVRTWLHAPSPGGGLDEPLAYRDGPDGPWTFLHYDDLGTTLAWSDEAGRRVARVDLDPWGQVVAGDASRPRLFAGHLVDPAAGLVLMRARAYDPALGRFLSPDPALLDGGLNAYAYADGNPVDAVDPLGLWSVPGWAKGLGSWAASKAAAVKETAVGAAEGFAYVTGLAGTPEMKAAARGAFALDFTSGRAQSRALGTLDGYTQFLSFGLVDPNLRRWAYDAADAELGRGYGTAGGVAFSVISGAGLLEAGGQAALQGLRAAPGLLRAAPGALRAAPGALRSLAASTPGALRRLVGGGRDLLAAAPGALRSAAGALRDGLAAAPAFVRANAGPLVQATGRLLKDVAGQVYNVTGRPFVNVGRDALGAARGLLRPLLDRAREARAARALRAAEGANGAATTARAASAARAPAASPSPGAAATPGASDNAGIVQALGTEERGAAVAAAARAARAPSSSESLTGLLDDVWARRDALAGQGSGPIYSAYNAVTEANPMARSTASYLEALEGIAAGRPAGRLHEIQGLQEAERQIAGVAARRAAAGPESVYDKAFYRFLRGEDKSGLWSITARVYVNANADTAPELMRRLVREILDDPARFPGVELAKLSGPGKVGARAENIVLYTSSPESSQRVVDALARIQAERPALFRDSIPRMTQPATSGGATLRGVAQGAEPSAINRGASFGQVRSQAIANALERTRRAGGDRAMFDRLVQDELRAVGVDPALPHLNLPELP